MKSLNEIYIEYNDLQNKLSKINGDKTTNIELISDDIISNAERFLQKLNIVLDRFDRSNPNLLVIRNNRYYVNNENRKIDYEYNSIVEISTEAVKTINDALRNLNSSISTRHLVRLGVALNTFYDIVDNVKRLEEIEISKAKNESQKNQEIADIQKNELNVELDKINDEIKKYFDSKPKDIRDLSLDDAYDELSKKEDYSHKINLGTIVDNPYSKAFIKHVSNLGYVIENGYDLNLEAFENKNMAFINVPNTFLRRNAEFEDNLKDLILRSFINFEPKSYELAFIEGDDGEVMLAPIVDFIMEASSDYIISGDVADNEEKTNSLIKELNNEIKNRIRTFKTIRTGVCKSLEDYNKLNFDNPLRYIFLIIKDYPSGFMNKDIREKLENIILDGARVGVMALIIGQNEELNVGYNQTIPPLSVPSEFNIVYSNNNFEVNNKLFELKNANYNFDDIELIKLRLKKASSFSLDNILENNATTPFYEEVSIPLGKVGGEVYSLRASTEKPPYPFILVTGGTGCGKSAFMHEIILSGAYKYSPDELEFHVIDFKSADKATEFQEYQYGGSMYIPHIKYLSLKSRPENALDIINYIQKLKSKRNRLGKFKSYNESNPNKKMPLIYVIIDEYESMLAGGEASGGDAYETLSLQSSIQDGITKILKTARAFGIGIIFSGQATKGLPNDAFAQISTKIAFKNKQDIIDKIFPGLNLDLDIFPKDDYRGLAYVSSNDMLPKFAKFAFAGNTDVMAKRALEIRNKYPEETKAHIQSIIGGTSSADVRLDSFLPWENEIENRLLDAEGDYDSHEQFLSSKQDKIIKGYRPLALGQSSSSEATIYLDYQKDENGHNFYAFGRNENLCPIERNLMLSFLYQISEKNYQDKHIIFMDGSRFGIKDELFGSLLDKYPFINKQIEYITDKTEMARKLLSLEKRLKDNETDNPYLIIIHEIDWLNGSDYLPKVEKKEESTSDKKQNSEIKSSLESLENKGIKVPSFLMNANFAAANTNTKKEEFSSFTVQDVKKAFKQLYLNGMLYENFMFVSSIKYENINNNIISLINDSKGQEQMKNYSVYGSYDMLKTQSVGTSVNANICYVLNGSNSRSTTRLFDYESDSAKDWWARLEKMMYIWR